MPYVEGFDTWPFGEEWLWEALAGVYLPMLRALREAPVTLGVTPVLCDQLEALRGEAGERFLSFLRTVRADIHAEDSRGLEEHGERELAAEVRRAAGDYSTAAYAFERLRGDLLGELHELHRGGVELWGGAATHAVLPLVATDAGLRLQVAGGIASHERRFESWTGGFWLPECAYRAGLERDLAEHGVRCFCVDQTDALGLGSLDQLEPRRPPGAGPARAAGRGPARRGGGAGPGPAGGGGSRWGGGGEKEPPRRPRVPRLGGSTGARPEARERRGQPLPPLRGAEAR